MWDADVVGCRAGSSTGTMNEMWPDFRGSALGLTRGLRLRLWLRLVGQRPTTQAVMVATRIRLAALVHRGPVEQMRRTPVLTTRGPGSSTQEPPRHDDEQGAPLLRSRSRSPKTSKPFRSPKRQKHRIARVIATKRKLLALSSRR